MAAYYGENPEAIASIARPLRSEADIADLAHLLSGARFVLLGEATHGTHEFYDLRASLTRRLVGQHGFAAVCVEGDWPDARRVDRYIRRQGDDATAIAALAGFDKFPHWMWRNHDVVALVDWLRSVNAVRPPDNHVGFYVLDLYSLHASVRAVVSFLDDVDPEAAARARKRYACFDGADPVRDALALDCEDEVVAQLVEMQMRRAARSGRSPAGDAWFHAIQEAHVVRDAEAYYRAMFADHTASWNLRDTHMADTVELVADNVGPRLVVWAHNSHVGDARATEVGEDGRVTLGQILRERHPTVTALVGFTTHEGIVAAATEWDGPVVRERVRPSLPGSWEELFHGTDLPRFVVAAQALERVTGDAARLHRAIGVVYRPDSERRIHYLKTRLARQFDYIVHVDRTRAVDALDTAVPATTSEVPDTFPTGV